MAPSASSDACPRSRSSPSPSSPGQSPPRPAASHGWPRMASSRACSCSGATRSRGNALLPVGKAPGQPRRCNSHHRSAGFLCESRCTPGDIGAWTEPPWPDVCAPFFPIMHVLKACLQGMLRCVILGGLSTMLLLHCSDGYTSLLQARWSRCASGRAQPGPPLGPRTAHRGL